MKDGKILGLVLGIVNIILIVVCLFFFLRMDRTAPKLEFQANDLVYNSNMEDTRLMEGITAYDAHDGDITDRIVIEKKIENRDDNTLVVFYAVSDKAGNVTKASREFGARFLPENKDEMLNEIKEAGIDAALDTDEESATSENGEMNTDEETEAEATAVPTQTPEATSSPSPSPTATPSVEPTVAPEQTEESAPQQEAPRSAPAAAPEGAPTLTLKVSEVKAKVGVKPALVEIIGKLADDKDSYETLFHNIVISKYDINKAGTYQVTLTAQDTDGNQSTPQPLTIIVE